MLYREIIAVCSQIHTKHINTAVWAECRILNTKLGGNRNRPEFWLVISYTDFVRYLSCVYYPGCSWVSV